MTRLRGKTIKKSNKTFTMQGFRKDWKDSRINGRKKEIKMWNKNKKGSTINRFKFKTKEILTGKQGYI